MGVIPVRRRARWLGLGLLAGTACSATAPATTTSPPQALGAAPIPVPEADGDQRWVVDQGTSLDRDWCGRAINVAIPVQRFIGSPYITEAGRLTNDTVAIAVHNGVVAPEVVVRVAAYDVDPQELDVATLNAYGARRSRLIGSNKGWSISEFRFPVRVFKFSPSRGALDLNAGTASAPPVARNTVSIGVDTRQQGWCARVDWISVEVKSLAPIAAFHGIGADPQSTFEGTGVAERLAGSNVSFEWRAQLPKFGRTAENAPRVVVRAKAIAKAYGAKRVHLMGNSKGGNWVVYAAGNYDFGDIKVESVSTVGSPLRGSILADMRAILLSAAPGSLGQALFQYDPILGRFGRADGLLRAAGQGPYPPGLYDIMTTAPVIQVGLSAEGRVSGRTKFFHWAAEADTNDDGEISVGEGQPLSLVSGAACFLNQCPDLTWLYRLLGTAATVRSRIECPGPAPNVLQSCHWQTTTLPEPPPPGQTEFRQFMRNDLVVTAQSAAGNGQLVGTLAGNHMIMNSADNYLRVFEHIRNNFPVR